MMNNPVVAAIYLRTWAAWSASQRMIAMIAATGILLWVIAPQYIEEHHGLTSIMVWDPARVFLDTPPCKLSSRGEPICGEPSNIASPRTLYSARTAEQYRDWFSFHAELLEQNGPAAYYSSQLNFLGDSITESWRGTSTGYPCKRCKGIPAVLSKYFGQEKPAVLGIAGDQTQHLLYRLQVARKFLHTSSERTAFVVLIGTNNLGAGYSVEETTMGIVATVDELLETTKSEHILLLQLLPRADDESKWKPDTLTSRGISFQQAVDEVNAKLVSHKPFQTNERISLVNCNGPLLNENGTANRNLMPDGLHPNARGHELMARCILDCWKDNKCG